MASIKLTIKSNFAEATREIKSIGDLTERESKRIEKFNKSFKSTQIDTFIQKNQRAAAAIQATRGPVEAAKTKQYNLRREIERLINNGLDPESESLVRLRREYIKSTEIVEANSRAQRKNEEAIKQNEEAQKRHEKVVRAMGVALLALTAITARVASKGAKDWMEYSRSIANVNTMIDMSSQDFENLDDSLTKLSNTFAIQKRELSSGVYQALSAGAEDLDAALEIVKASATLGRGALIDNAAAVDIVTTAMNAYGKETVTAASAIDTYFTIIKQGKINGEQLSQVIGQSISLFAAAKIPIDQLGAGIATLTKVGVQSSEATTQLNGVVSAFLKPSEAMSKELEKIGYSSGAAFLETEGLAGVIEFLGTASEGSLDIMAEMVPNIRGLRGALAAASNDGQTFNDVLAAFKNQSGAANKALEAQTKGFAKDAYTMEQARIALQNVNMDLGEKFLPIIARAAENIVSFITDGERLGHLADWLVPLLGGLTAALAAFVIGSAIAKVGIAGLAKSFVKLASAMLANPLTWIVVGISAAVVVIILLYRNWDKVFVFMETTIEKLGVRFSQFAGFLKTYWIMTINYLKSAFTDLGLVIVDNVLGAVAKLLGLAAKLPLIGDKFAGLVENVDGFRDSLRAVKDEAIAQNNAITAAVKEEQSARAEAARENIAAINAEKEARMAALKEQESELEEFNSKASSSAGVFTPVTVGTGEDISSLSDRLSELNNIEAIANQERLSTFSDFLSARMEQEGIDGEARIEFLRGELSRIKELENLSNEERVAAEKIVQEQITDIQKEQARTRRKMAESTLGNMENMFASLVQVTENAGKKSRALVIIQKSLAIAQIAIDTVRGAMKAIADYGLPWGLIPAAAITAQGIAAGASVASQSIPSAESGGRFIVPDNPASSRGDSQIMRVNPGEEANVVPRGESDRKIITVNNYFDKQLFWTITQEGLDSGAINVSSDNIRSA